jgi:hypothetical protein
MTATGSNAHPTHAQVGKLVEAVNATGQSDWLEAIEHWLHLPATTSSQVKRLTRRLNKVARKIRRRGRN